MGLNIYQRINEVRKKVDYAKKNKRVGEGGYLAVTHDAVTALTRDHFVEHGIVIVPNLLAHQTVLTGTSTSRGIPFVRFEASYKFDVVNADDPNDKFAVSIAAHAIDQGDKAPGKALSYAKKYCVLKLLEIESGEEDEDRQEQHKPKNTATQLLVDEFAKLSPDRKNAIIDIATAVVDHLNEGETLAAYVLCEKVTDQGEKMALWSRFDSKQRSTLKAQGELQKQQTAAK